VVVVVVCVVGDGGINEFGCRVCGSGFYEW
jgi:hypothetical protein